MDKIRLRLTLHSVKKEILNASQSNNIIESLVKTLLFDSTKCYIIKLEFRFACPRPKTMFWISPVKEKNNDSHQTCFNNHPYCQHCNKHGRVKDHLNRVESTFTITPLFN